MNQQEIGLHLILVPATDMIASPAINALGSKFDKIAAEYNCVAVADYAREDHWHFLFKCAAHTDIANLIQSILDESKQYQRGQGNNDFMWSDEVHVTLLPPWHVEIMASFVRDQDRFHQRFTFEEELDMVFRPNAPLPEDKNQLLSAHIH